MFECKKLDPNSARVRLSHCVRYSELASQGCPQRKAIIFASKRYCRYDATKKLDGPVGFRLLSVTNGVSMFYNQQGWLLKEPAIGNLQQSASKPNPETKWLQNYIDIHTKDITDRTKELERRVNSTSDFYKQLNKKYSFKKMPKDELMKRLKEINNENRHAQQEEDIIYEGKITKQADDIFKNLNRTKKKFREIEVYQQTIKSLAKKSHELDFMSHHNKYMLEVLKKDRNVIEQFNNANYKFPLYNTSQTNSIPAKTGRITERDPKTRYSFRSLSHRL